MIGSFAFPFLRIIALMYAAPILSHRSIPTRLKVGLALLLAFAAGTTAPVGATLDSPLAGAWALRELAIGLALGILMRLVFGAAELAGEAIGIQMGLGFAYFVDPQNSGQTPLVGSFYATLAALLFLAIDGHLLLIGGLLESFRAFPVDAPFDGRIGWAALAGAGSEMFRLALAICLPVLAGLMLVNLALGMLSRSAPQLNLFAIGFPVTLFVGMMVLAPSLPGAVEALTQAIAAWPGTFGR